MKCNHGKFRQNCGICSSEKVFRRYQRQAKERNLAFSLTLDEFETLVNQVCVFCGERPAGGVDRRSNALGYSPENSQACCGICNKLKSSLNQFSFLAQVQKISRYQESQRQNREQVQPKTPEKPDPRKNEPIPELFLENIPPEARRFLDEGWDPGKRIYAYK